MPSQQHSTGRPKGVINYSHKPVAVAVERQCTEPTGGLGSQTTRHPGPNSHQELPNNCPFYFFPSLSPDGQPGKYRDGFLRAGTCQPSWIQTQRGWARFSGWHTNILCATTTVNCCLRLQVSAAQASVRTQPQPAGRPPCPLDSFLGLILKCHSFLGLILKRWVGARLGEVHMHWAGRRGGHLRNQWNKKTSGQN